MSNMAAGEVVTRIQLYTSRANVYVETETMQQAELIVAQHQGKHSLTIDGTSYPLPILLEDGATEVWLHELPPYVTGAEIEAAICCFGKVVSITETEYGRDS
uniref:RRM domain-containing protein n=1 Tax=Anopheles coluzzii TaxID=1518534 RepID=A0A8W7P1U0_ANOCL